MSDAVSVAPTPSAAEAAPSIESLTQFVRGARERDEASNAGRSLAAKRVNTARAPENADLSYRAPNDPYEDAPSADGLDEPEPEPETLDEPDSEQEPAETAPDEEVVALFGEDLAPDIAALDPDVRDRMLAREREVTRVLQGAAERFRGVQEEARIAAEASATLQQQLAVLQDILPQLEATLQDKWANVDWAALARESPEQYWQYRALHDEELRVLTATQQAEQQRMAVMREQFAREERAKIVQIVPDFADPTKARAHEARMRATAQRFGVSQETYDSLNASEAALLHYASLYLEGRQAAQGGKPAPAQTQTPQGRQPPRGLPSRSNSNLSSKSRRDEQVSRAANRVQKEGTIDSLVDLVRLRRGG